MRDDYTPRTLQDDFDDGDEDLDPFTEDENEDITEVLHVDPDERRQQLEDNENPDLEQSEDAREELEDRDQET